jgi:hypothetical protein
MAKVFSTAPLVLLPGVKEEDFEKFVKEEFSVATMFPEWKLHILKGERGDREGKYLAFFEIESIEDRNRFFPNPSEPSEEAKQFAEDHPETMKLFEKLETLVGGFSLIITDYVELG